MSTIRRLNHLLRDLDTPFEHRWLHTESPELLHPQIEIDPDTGKDVHEYACVCGVDVLIHRPDCRFTVARKKVKLLPLLSMDGISNRWVLCRRHYTPRSVWAAQYGTHVQYPENGKWHPISIGTGIIALPEGAFPTEDDTRRAMELIRQSESIHLPTFSADRERAQEASEQEQKEQLADMIDDDAGFIAVPGSKGCVSRPSVPNVR